MNIRKAGFSLAIFLLCGLVLVVSGRWLRELPVQSLQLEGSFEHLHEQDVHLALAPHLEAGLFGIDLAAAQRSVDALPWVERSALRRLWPDSIAVRVWEHIPVARWLDTAGESVGLLGRSGSVIPAVDFGPALPVLGGPPQSGPDVLAMYARLQQEFASLHKLERSRHGAWTMTLANGPVVRLGRRDLDQRLNRLRRLLEQRTAAERDLVSVDLRYDAGMAIAAMSSKDRKNDEEG